MENGVVFICHATPDDNDFVRWLGGRLTGHGYKVWADLFELKGGTPFWSTIESALRHHAIKVIFVVSKNSVGSDRSGVRNELSVADAIKKSRKDPGFIIPLKIDDTPFSDFPIQIHQLNALDFSAGWGSKLIDLLDALDAAKVPKFASDQTRDFDNWRATMMRTSTIVEAAPEIVVTNLLPILEMPKKVLFFEAQGESEKVAPFLKKSGIPHNRFLRLFISFADLSELQAAVPSSFELKVRAHVPFADFLNGTARDVTSPLKNEARNIATSLIRQHVERHLLKRGLMRFDTASSTSFYFPSGLLLQDKVSYTAASGRKTNKNVVGRSERNRVNWHLSMKVNVVLGANPLIRFKPYVCFSEDGQKAISDAKRTSAIRRRFCRNWWNRHWRQLQEAFCMFLSEGQETVEVGLGGSEKLVFAGKLLELTAARKIPGDLILHDDADDPEEPEDEEDLIDLDVDLEEEATEEFGDGANAEVGEVQ